MGDRPGVDGNGASAEDGALDALETREDLARELTALRTRAGLSVRTLARRLDLPTATVGDYFSGRHLPGVSQVASFRAVLHECGVADREAEDWLRTVSRIRLASDRRVARVRTPYLGLEPYGIADAEVFFGREAVTEEILDRLREMTDPLHGRAEGAAELILLGPSGSGKSSVLRAGVAASVEAGALDTSRESWAVVVIAPGDAPTQALQARLRAVEHRPLLVIVDQLEEIFGVPPAERESFLAELNRLRLPEVLVIAGLRADFYAAALMEPLMLPTLARRQIVLGPMNEEEARRTILEPARHVGAQVEPGLADLLIAELAAGEPDRSIRTAGALPLLSHALLATWHQTRGNRLTIADLRDVGGLRGAVSQSAEQLFETLSEEERERARRVFSRLVRVTADGPLTRRRVARRDLDEIDAPAGADSTRNGSDPAHAHTSSVVDRFVAARLLTADADTIELSHEALLTAWPRLAEWIERDRAGLRLHHEITDGARAWVEADQDPSLLFRGARLHASTTWAHEPANELRLTRTEREFLAASLALLDAEQHSARTRARRMQGLTAVLACVAAAALVLALVAGHARHVADKARNDALSRQVAIEASTLERTDPGLAMQLALAAYRIAPTLQATSTLINSSAYEMPTRILGQDGTTTESLSGNGDELALADSAIDEVSLYRMTTPTRPQRIATVSPGVRGEQLFATAVSPDGRLLAAGGTAGKVTVWSLATPSHPVKLATLGGFKSTVYGVVFSPDGRSLAAADYDGTVRQWSLSVPSHPAAGDVLAVPGRASVQALSYAPDGDALAAVTAAGAVVTWRVAGPDQLLAARTATARTVAAGTALTSVAYSPNGRTLAIGAEDDLVHLFRVDSDGRPATQLAPLHGFTNYVNSVAFSRDGRYLAAGGSDSTVRIWATSGWTKLATLVHPAVVTGVLFTPDGQHIVSADEDGTARVWSFPPPASLHEPGGVYSIDYTANGTRFAAVTGEPDGVVDLWNSSDPWRPAHLATVPLGQAFGQAAAIEAFSPNGRLLAVGNLQGKVELIDVADPLHTHLLGRELAGATPDIEELDFSPNLATMSVTDGAGRIELWNIRDPADPTRLPTLDPSGVMGEMLGAAFSPDGQLLATASNDDKVRLWNIADPGRARLLATLGGFKSYAFTVAFTPNGRTLIAGSADDTVRLWNVSDPARPRELGRPLTASTSSIYDVDVNRSGTLLAAASTAGDVLVWNIRDPARPVQVADLTAASGTLYDVTFSPDGSTLAASGADQVLHFWDDEPSAVASRICAVAGQPITRSEWTQYIQGAAYDPPCTSGRG